jgi:hypothetical protein
VHSLLGAIIALSSPVIARDKDIFFSCPARIEALSVAFSVSMLNPAKTIDRFSAVLSAFAKSLSWRNICYSNS